MYKNAQQCDTTGQSSSPQSTRMNWESQRGRIQSVICTKLERNHLCIKSLLDFSFQNDKMRLCLTTNDMYLSLICWHDPLHVNAKMGHLSREETIIVLFLMAVCTERYDLCGKDVPLALLPAWHFNQMVFHRNGLLGRYSSETDVFLFSSQFFQSLKHELSKANTLHADRKMLC